MTINIIGASGRLGQKVVRALLARGVTPGDIVGTVRSPEKAQELQAEGVTIRRGDYEDGPSMEKAFEGSEVVLLIPTFAPVEERILQHHRAVEAARSSGVRRVVFASFAAATPESLFLVAPFMLYAESRLRLCGLDWTICRNGMYADEITEWVPKLKELGFYPEPVNTGRAAYVSRADLAQALAAVLADDGHSKKLYELTGPEALTSAEVAEKVSDAIGTPLPFRSQTDEEFRKMSLENGLPEKHIILLLSLYRALEAGELNHVTDHIERITGRTPKTVATLLASG